MEMYKLLALADDTDKSFDGLFSGTGHIVGIVLIVTGLLLLYIAFKVAKGYSFMPTLGSETVIKEDNYVEGTAKAVEKIVTRMPDPNGGEDREFVEWKIVYTAGGEEYSQDIPDDGYSEGEKIKIKYDPAKPSAYYIAEEKEDTDESEDTSDEGKSKMTGLILGVLGVLVILGGVALYFNS
ncbi:DUF3592 domain-containing protein [Ruminococcus albus]|uniref:DUF3592 domain-containing protein n=1 Tax=Ruminococcus albus TaxID=1264 RepID=A0A1H7GHL0_RUMAL|nr:DUF3592 domain-containing protein [Ruminococcus albus]SEK37574.1 hypothetical protein SAMN05216469_102111 [Ruminococcus albus]